MDELETLVEEYGQYKDQEKIIKNEVNSRNTQIKDIMKKQGLDDFVSANYTATYSVSHSESLDEEKLITLFYSLGISDEAKSLGIIKTKEYIDSDVLESAIYRGDLSKKVISKMQPCIITKDTPKLNIKANKK